MTDDSRARAYCPSSAPEIPGSAILGVVRLGGEGATVSYLSQPVPFSDEIAAALEGVSSGEVLRIAAPCLENECPHFRDSDCTLITKIVRATPDGEPATPLPRCYLRSRCRWWKQEKAAACARCPMIITDRSDGSDLRRWIADSTTSAAEFDPRDFPGHG